MHFGNGTELLRLILETKCASVHISKVKKEQQKTPICQCEENLSNKEQPKRLSMC